MRFLESTRLSSWGILMKFWENCKKILKKLNKNWEENFKWLQENYGKIIDKNLCRYSILMLKLWKNSRQSEIISVKLGKTTEKS